MKKTVCPQYVVGILCVLLFVPVFGYNAAFFSYTTPGSPSQQDTVTIVSAGYLQIGGLVIDSQFSRSGNQFKMSYIFRPDINIDYVSRVNRAKVVGKLPAGVYTIITSTVSIDTSTSVPDTERYLDTAIFRVAAANAAVARIVGVNCNSESRDVRGDNPFSYYYWNGDTLSVAVAFPLQEMPYGFAVNASLHADTLDFTILDTTMQSMGMPMAYLVTGSLSPVKPAKYFLRVRYQRRSCANPYIKTDFHRSTVDCSQEGLTFSIKKAGDAEFTLFPADTDMNDYAYLLISPFFDTLRVAGFQPNPRCAAPRHPNIFLGAMTADDGTQVENWESYAKSKWHYVQAQQGDALTFDTVSANGGHMLKVAYSNSAGQAVRSYIYRNLDTAVASYTSSIRLSISFIPPDVTAIKKDGSRQVGISAASKLQIRYSRSSIRISLPRSAIIPAGGNLDKFNFTVTDPRGRTIRILQPISVKRDCQAITTVWDERDGRGLRVPAGMYLISMGANVAVAIVSR